MLYLSDAVARENSPSIARILEIVASSIRALDGGTAQMSPRATMDSRAGARFIAFPSVLEDESIAGVKWLGLPTASDVGRGGSTIVLSHIDDGTPFAVIDARWITAIRTVVVSLAAAIEMADPKSRRIGFIACGEQAKLHLEIFSRWYPLREVTAFSRRLETADAFAVHAEKLGYAAEAHASLNACVADADIVICSAPSRPSIVLDHDWLKPGCFCSLVDLGRSLAEETLPAGAPLVVDSLPQMKALTDAGKLKAFPSATVMSLSERSGILEPECSTPRFFLPTGLGPADLSIAFEIYKRAEAQGGGLRLPS